MVKDDELIESIKSKTFKQKRITEFLDEYADSNLKFNDERIKLCSSDDFNELSDNFKKIQKSKKAPIMISQVGGFYVMASLAGYAAANSRTKPVLLFFDKKTNNTANAIYNTLLMQAIDNKERYIATLFGLDDKDIIISLDPNKYIEYIIQVYKEQEDTTGIKADRIKVKALRKYRENRKEYDEIIAKEHDLAHRSMRELEENFNIANIEKYASKKKYDKEDHLELINKTIEGKLCKEHRELFEPIAKSMTEYLAKGENYSDLVKYLSRDIQKNSDNHILCNNSIYKGYKSLINKKGQTSVKFVPGVDISTETGIKKLENILENEKLIDKNNTSNKFSIDIAFLPHVETLQEAYPLLKKNVERFIKVNREGANNFSMHPTASLHVRTYDSIGAQFIEDERKARKPLKHLTPIDAQEKGFPLITFIAGANFGNIYNSEEDLNNVIEMAIADKVDTIYIQGLIYSTYYHNQTDRRMLIDPKYQTLDQRLKAAKKLVKRLNDNGIKVVYQMGDEEYHLYEDMFRIYTREQGVTGNNFLSREDKKSTYDWVRPIIIQELIPYLIRSGEDLTNFYTDEEQETRVTELCNAIKNYREGLPLGELAKYIKPEYLQDTDMFRVVYSTIDKFDEKDPTISVNLLSNPQFSSNTQYSHPTGGIIKNLKIHQSGALGSGKLQRVPQLFVDGRQAMMSMAYKGDQVTMNVPQMIDDSKYIEHPELLSGIKEHITSDPTHARVTKGSTRPNYPGSWTITGDAREKMTIIPYWKRSREVMEHVNKTGKGLEEVDVFYLNDIQVGSLTERLEYALKALDHFYYDYPAPGGIIGNGDFQQGWNYKGFANESRHLGTMSLSQQMVDFVKLVRPWIKESFGVINPTIFKEDNEINIDNETCAEIMNHLRTINIIDGFKGEYNNTDLIKDGIDYKTVDLKLPPKLQPYEEIIRDKLSSIKHLKFIHTAEGNHEWNSDWDKKGNSEVKFLNQELENMKKVTGSDIEIAQNEFIVNKRGDILQAPHGCKTINGYNTAYAHLYKSANGETPTAGMARFFDRMGDLSNEVHRAVMGHLHIFETSVIDNKLFTITGSAAGQSGFEQNLGLASMPLFVIDRYLPDGRIAQDVLGTEFLKNYKIQNPYVRSIGLDNFINMCLQEEAAINGFDGIPKDVQPVHQRKLVIAEPNKIIGPKID